MIDDYKNKIRSNKKLNGFELVCLVPEELHYEVFDDFLELYNIIRPRIGDDYQYSLGTINH